MPDWSYHPILRPLLFRLPAEPARDITLRATRTLAALPLGPHILEVFGQMQPPPETRCAALGLELPSPVGLGAGLDTHAVALSALARFGFGFLEVGPLTVEPVASAARIERRPDQQALWYPDAPVNDGLEAITRRLERATPLPVPLGIRLAHRTGADAREATRERAQMILHLQQFAAFFMLETQGPAAAGEWSAAEWAAHLDGIMQALEFYPNQRPLLLCLAPDLDRRRAQALLAPAMERGISGVVVTGGVQAVPAGRLGGVPARDRSIQMVEALHRAWGEQLTIVGSGGVHEPEDALRLLEAGATLVQVESGLVYAGPGLPKRINEAIGFYQPSKLTIESMPRASRAGPGHALYRLSPLFRLSWFWMALLGASMVLGGTLAFLIAATWVVLPYDEAFVGLDRAQLAAINPRLLLFMAHDRVTLAGVMISIGLLYSSLALFGMCQGNRWAWRASCVSAVLGFATFFLFLGFGYFDPLHALVSVILFIFFLFALRGRSLQLAPQSAPGLRNDRAWRLSLWGQLLLITLGVGIIGAGLVIGGIGVTRVFVPEDLGFLNTTAATLHNANAHLVPLIAHDRAGFGGALVADGLAVLLSALWGFRQGNRWLWWMFVGAGVPAIAAALGVHLVVGYTNIFHLSPVLALLVLFPLALALCYPYLCRAAPQTARDKEWMKRLASISQGEEAIAAPIDGNSFEAGQ